MLYDEQLTQFDFTCVENRKIMSLAVLVTETLIPKRLLSEPTSCAYIAILERLHGAVLHYILIWNTESKCVQCFSSLNQMHCSVRSYKQAPAVLLVKRDPYHQLMGKMDGMMVSSRRREMEREQGWRECSWRLNWSWRSQPRQGAGWNWKRFVLVTSIFNKEIWRLWVRTPPSFICLYSNIDCFFSQVVQQLVEERLRVLQLTVFDHSVQELRDRMEKIDAATKQQKTVQHTLQVSLNLAPSCTCSHYCDTWHKFPNVFTIPFL